MPVRLVQASVMPEGLWGFRLEQTRVYWLMMCVPCLHHVQDKLEALVKKYDVWSGQHGAGRLRYIVWDLTPVLYADSMGLHLMEDIVLWTRKKGIVLILANPCKRLVRDW